MKKRLLSLFLAFVMVLSLLPVSAGAAELELDACGENLTCTVDGSGNLTISGTGPMDDFYYNDFMGYSSAPWGDRFSDITSVVIEDGVTSIGDYAFYNFGNLTSVSIPDTVTSIGESAFYSCGLTSVEIPDSVTEIEPRAFDYCWKMTSLKLSAGLTAIPEAAFSNCQALTSVAIPEKVTSIGPQAFNCCYALTSVNIPDSVTAIGASAFSACSKLTEVNIPSGVTALEYGVFSSCSALESVTIPKNVTSLGNFVFGYCSGLQKITFMGDAPSIGSYAFYNVTATCDYPAGNDTWASVVGNNYGGTLTWEPTGASQGVTWNYADGVLTISGTGDMENYLFDEMEWVWLDAPPWVDHQEEITQVIIEDGVTSIGDYAFYDYYNLESVTIPDSVVTIGDYVFCDAGLTEVVLPDSVTAVGDFAFSDLNYGNYCLTTLEIGSGLQSIGKGAFRSCSSLTSITVDAANTAYCVRDNVLFSKDMSTLVLCPAGLWLTEYSIPDGVTAIADYAFDSNYNLETVSIPGSMKSIGDSAFASTWLTTLTLPNGLECIGNSAFEATSLTSVIIPDSVTTIGSNAFNISNLKSVQIGSGVNTIGNFAFGYGSYLETITVSDGNTAFCIDEGALLSADKTELLKYPAQKEASGYEIPAGVVTICDGAFSYAKNLTQITIPESVSEIGKEAFYCCEKLGSAAIPDHVKEISDYTFGYCSSLASVTLGSGVEKIGYWAFASCSLLSEIVFPQSLKEIGEQAFISCSKLTSITFEGDAPTIADSAFYSVATVNPENGNSTCATGYYPANNATWTEDVLKNYGGGSTNSGILKWEAVAMGGSEEPENSCGENLTWTLVDGVLTISGSGAMYDYAWVDVECTAPWYDCGVTQVILDDGVTAIGDYAFYETGITEITIPDGVTSVGAYAFSSCYSLENVTIPASVTSIGDSAFMYCESLTEITLPGAGVGLGSCAFANSGLKEITILGNVVPSYGATPFDGVIATVYYPAEYPYWPYMGLGGTLTWVAVGGDTTPPEITELWAEDEVCSGIAFTKINVEASDDVGVASIVLTYALEGGQAVDLATLTESGAATWDDMDQLPDGTYTVTAVAYDAAGNASDPATVTVIVDNVKPVLTALNVVNSAGGTQFGGKYDTVFLSVSGTNLGSGDTVTVSYPFLDDGAETTKTLSFTVGTQPYELDISSWESGTYTFEANICDAAGNTNTLSGGVTITVDNTAPPAPTALLVTAEALKNTLSWNKSTEANTVHCVYRAEAADGVRELLKRVDSDAINQTYVDTAVEVGKTYYYWVTAQDALGNVSAAAASEGVTVLPDETKPWVSAISPVNKSTLSGTANITITAEDDIAVSSVALECSPNGEDWTAIGSVSTAQGTFAVDTTQYGETLYLRITVADSSGNQYVNSETYSYSIDNTPPEQVTGLTGTATSTVATLNWNDVTAADFSYFVVEQLVGREYRSVKTVSDALGVYVTGLRPDIEYTFRVYAVDKCGNKGEVSEPCAVITLADTTAPVITNIRPNPSRYNGDTTIPLVFTVADDYGVDSLSVQTSYDGTQWIAVGTVSVNTVGTSVRGSYNLSTASLNEGVLYVRAVATDMAGNVSDSSNSAPYTQYAIDRTAPAAPTGLTAKAGQGSVSLTWEQGSEDDLSIYTVYRAAADGTFAAVASGLKQLYLVDTNVTVGTTYSYYIDVVDQVGNRSAASAAVSAVPLDDTTAPNVVSVSPSNDYIMGPSTAIQVKVSDNQQVAELYYQVSADGGANWGEPAAITVNAAERVVSLPLMQKELTCDAFRVRLWCVDAAGNQSGEVERSYGLDRTAPHAPAITVKADNMAIQLSWVGGSEDDLSGYRVYRTVEGGSNQLLFQRSGGQSSYSYTDNGVSVGSAYSYYIEAVDTRGNTASGQPSDYVYPINKDVVKPTVVLDGATSGATGYEISFTAARSVDNVGVTAYHWDFGDDTTADTAAVNHAFAKAGTYTVTVTVSDAAGNSASDSMTVTIRDPESVGALTIQVRDESGQVVPDAGIYMDLGSDSQSLLYTNSMGTITLRPKSGVHVIGVYTDGYLPAKTTVNVVAGRSETITINVVKKDIVVGELTVERMTLEQIKAAGIDVNDPANQFVYEFNIQLTYGTYEAYLSAQCNGEGKTLKDPEPVEVVDEYGDTRYLYFNVVPIRPGGGGGGSDTGTGGGSVGPGFEEKEVPMVVIMDIPGKASWLKDFFDVRLTVINQADSQFVLDDCLAYLNVPAGLTLMDTIYTKAEPSYDMGSIAGQQSQTAHWVLRGDKGGEYNLTADFSAILREFGTKISARFETEEPFRVRQGDGLTLDIVVENAILADTDGSIKVGLRNDDEFPYYLPDLTLDPEVVKLVDTYKTNGRVKVNTDRDTLKTGETIWWEYIVPRENWETLTTYNDQDFYLMEAIVEATGGNAELPYTIQEVMPFTINGDLIEVTRLSSSGAESEISYVNIAKSSLAGGTVPSLAIRTYRQNEETHEYELCPMEITIKDEHIIKKGKDANGNEVGEDGITVTTDSNGYYCYKGYNLIDLYNTKSYNIRISASRAKPVEIPVVMRGTSVATGLLTVYTYTGSGDDIQVLEGAEVTLMEADSTNATGTTDKDGKIVFKRVDQGHQELVITKDGYLPLRELVEVGEESEYSFRLVEDPDPTATRIIQISNSLSDYTKGNQTVIPAGGIKGTVKFSLKSRIADGETFECYHYRIVGKDGTVRETDTFKTDTAFWLDLSVLQGGDTLEFAIENTEGEISAYMDSNLLVFEQPDFFNGLVYDLSKIQMGGSIDTSSTFKFDPFATLEALCVTEIAAGIEVGDDEDGHKAAALAYMNKYVFSSSKISQKFPLTAKYDLSGKLTISVICGASAKTTTTTKGSYGVGGVVSNSSASYGGSIELSQDSKKSHADSGQIQLDFVFQYLPEKDDWSLTVYLGASATQKLIDKDATFLKVVYVAGEVELKEKIKLEVVKTHVGPGDATKLFDNGLIPDSFNAEGEAKVSAGLTLVDRKLASVGLYVKAGLEFQFLPYWSLAAKTALGAEGNVLIWKKEKDLVSGEWEASGDTSVAALAAFALYDMRSNQQERLDVVTGAERDGGWQGNLGTEQWIAGADSNADAQLITLPDGSILAVWCDYTNQAADPVALYWSVYTDDSWSTPARVDDDGTADLYPSLIATDTGAQLVWVDFTDSVAGMDSLTYAEIEAQVFQMLGVTTASFTEGGWTVAEAYEGGILAANPEVAVGADGSVLAAWIANQGNLEEASAEYPDCVSWVLLDAQGTILDCGSMTAPVAAIADLGVGCGENGYQLAVLAQQETGELRLYCAEQIGTTWTGFAAASNLSGEDAAMAMTASGVIYTINSGRLYAYENGRARHLLQSDLLPDTAGNLTCSETPLGTVLLWTCLQGSDSVVCMSIVKEDGTASLPVVVEYTTDGVFSAPTAAVRESELTLLFQRAYLQDDSWCRDVERRTIAAGLDLSLENSQIQHSTHLVPGLDLESYIVVDSLGAIAPDEFAVEIYTVKDGVETVIKRGTGTSSRNVTLQWTVPEDYAGEAIFLRVEHPDDCNEANNTIALNNLVRELAVSGAAYVGRLNGKDIFTVDVENQGLVMSDATVLSVKVIGADDVLLEQEIAALDAGAKQTIRLELTGLGCSDLSLAFMVEPLVGEGDLANNNEYLILPAREHKFDAWSAADAKQHQSTCSVCRTVGYADHRWNDGNQCTDCGLAGISVTYDETLDLLTAQVNHLGMDAGAEEVSLDLSMDVSAVVVKLEATALAQLEDAALSLQLNAGVLAFAGKAMSDLLALSPDGIEIRFETETAGTLTVYKTAVKNASGETVALESGWVSLGLSSMDGCLAYAMNGTEREQLLSGSCVNAAAVIELPEQGVIAVNPIRVEADENGVEVAFDEALSGYTVLVAGYDINGRMTGCAVSGDDSCSSFALIGTDVETVCIFVLDAAFVPAVKHIQAAV